MVVMMVMPRADNHAFRLSHGAVESVKLAGAGSCVGTCVRQLCAAVRAGQLRAAQQSPHENGVDVIPFNGAKAGGGRW
jgi:hypothetical protein